MMNQQPQQRVFKLLCFLVLLLNAAAGVAQACYSCDIKGDIRNDEFHKIKLSSAIIAKLNDSGSNIRLYSKGDNKEIPYLFDFNKSPGPIAPEFREYDI